MILLKLLPGVLKELTRHVPTVFFQVIEWSEITSEIPRFSKRVLQKEGFRDFFQQQKSFLAPLKIPMSDQPPSKEEIDFNVENGKKLLEIYFAQVFSPHGLFLDMRSQNFSQSSAVFTWHPSGAWTKLDDKFRRGIMLVYDGFYSGNETHYRQGLIDIGLMDPDWSEEDKRKLSDLFREQFGDAQTQEVSFTLEHFNDSMTRMFNFILSKKRKITRDFLYLGIYLVTLYSALEKIKSSLPVKAVYLSTKEKFSESI